MAIPKLPWESPLGVSDNCSIEKRHLEPYAFHFTAFLSSDSFYRIQMDDFDTLRPRYPPIPTPTEPSSKNPYDYFDGDQECLPDFLNDDQDDDFEPSFLGKGREESESPEEDPDPTSSFVFQLKSVGPKLVPFLKSLGMYFVIFVPVDRPSWFAVLIKCLPIASLALFVVLHGISFGQRHAYARKILIGLVLSGIGDAFLVWPSYFVQGMFMFSLAQVSYIWAFGLEPLSATLGVVIYAVTSIGLGMIMPGVMLNEDKGLLIGVPIYFVLLTTMVWRACARLQLFEDLWTWTKLCSCLGSISFVVSDSTLGLNKFFVEVPNSQAIVMSTYYLAQLGLALSVVNSHKAQVRGEVESEVIDIDGYSVDQPSFITSVPSNTSTSGRHVGWRDLTAPFDSDDDDELTLPKTTQCVSK